MHHSWKPSFSTPHSLSTHPFLTPSTSLRLQVCLRKVQVNHKMDGWLGMADSYFTTHHYQLMQLALEDVFSELVLPPRPLQ